MDTTLTLQERYYQLDGVVFRVRLDRLEQGAQYLRNGIWVWTPVTSGGVIHDSYARELAEGDAERYRLID